MKFFLTLLLIVTILASFLIIGISFRVGGVIYGSVVLVICLYLIYILNSKINRLNIVHKLTDRKALDISHTDIKNKFIFINTKSFFNLNITLVQFILMSIVLIFILLILRVSHVEKGFTLVLFFGTFLIFVFTFSLSNTLKGRIEFIDIDTNNFYIIVSGIFSLKYKKFHFNKIENLIAIKVLGRSRQKILADTNQSFSGENLLLTIDNKETLIFQPSSRKQLNNIINGFKEKYSLECHFKTLGRDSILDYSSSFKNTLYNFEESPKFYFMYAIYILFSICVTFLLKPEDYMYLCPFLLISFYFFVLYFKSKKGLEDSLRKVNMK